MDFINKHRQIQESLPWAEYIVASSCQIFKNWLKMFFFSFPKIRIFILEAKYEFQTSCNIMRTTIESCENILDWYQLPFKIW